MSSSVRPLIAGSSLAAPLDPQDGERFAPNRASVVRAVATSKRALWGIKPTGPAHLGLDTVFARLKDLQALGHEVIVVIDDERIDEQERHLISDYWESLLRDGYGFSVTLRQTSRFRTTAAYQRALWTAADAALVSDVRDALPTSAKAQPLSVGMGLRLLMQSVDAQYFGPLVVIADQAQYKIDRLGDRTGAVQPAVYVPLGVDVLGRELRASTSATRISVHESQQSLDAKLRRMYAPPANYPLEKDRQNALLALVQRSISPYVEVFVVETRRNGRLEFRDYESFASSWFAEKMHPNDVKDAISEALGTRLARLAKSVEHASTWIDLARVRASA